MNDTIAELTALEAKATPGRWEMAGTSILAMDTKPYPTHIAPRIWPKDAALIVKMRNALPEVLWNLQLNHNLKMERDVFLADAEKCKKERDAALARAEKAEEQGRRMADAANRAVERAEKAEAERDVLASKLTCCPGRDALKCSTDDCNANWKLCWLEWATQEVAKRGEEA